MIMARLGRCVQKGGEAGCATARKLCPLFPFGKEKSPPPNARRSSSIGFLQQINKRICKGCPGTLCNPSLGTRQKRAEGRPTTRDGAADLQARRPTESRSDAENSPPEATRAEGAGLG